MRSTSPEGLQLEASRPPVATHAAQPSGAGGRPTIRIRPWIQPVMIPIEDGYALVDPYVRRYWTAALGATAIADLLRIGAAAQAARRIRRPHRLSLLLSEGLVAAQGTVVVVGDRIPPLPPHLVRRLPAGLRNEVGRTCR